MAADMPEPSPLSAPVAASPGVDQPAAAPVDVDQPGAGPAAAPAKPARNLGPLRMVWGLAAQYPRQVLIALLALLTSSSATIAIPMRFRTIVDRGFGPGADVSDISGAFTLMLAIVVILGLATATRFYFVSWLGERVVADLREKVQANLLRLPPSFFEANSPKEISSRMTSDTALIEVVVGTTASIALRNVITGIGGTLYLFFLAPWLTLELLVAIPVIVLPIVLFARRLSKASRTSQDRIAEIGGQVTETLSAIRVVQSFNQEAREMARFHGAVDATFQAARRRIRTRAIMTACVTALIFGSITLLLWQGAIQVATGQITGGTIAAFVVTGGLVAGAFGALTEVYGDLLRGAGAASRLAELLAEQPAIAPPERPTALPVPPRGKIAFDRVTFRYPSRPEVAAIADFTLTVEPGETVAIVGPSGAGKSTVFQLAQRFYDPHAGTVRLDGVALTSADPAEIRRRIALVPQEGVLFAASARDNLRYGNWDASDEAIWQAARAANAEDFLRALPEGLDTFLGENGARLSGGQRQRIAIARALLRDAPILLLDEATSALDAESERLVQSALDRLMQSRTTLVIAHRLATVRQADRIVVMDQGAIVEQGTHDELSRQGGLYARLASLQFDERTAEFS
jgi:ATP-binding cassette subfamily B protein